MTNSSLDTYGPVGSARFVAMHGMKAIRSGGRPTLPFQGIADPEVAFRAAVVVQRIRPFGYSGQPRVVVADTYQFDLPSDFTEVFLAINALADVFFNLNTEEIDFDGVPVHIGASVLQVEIAGIMVRVDHKSSPLNLTEQWRRTHLGLTENKVVGPDNLRFSNDEERQYKDARLTRERLKERQASEALELQYDRNNQLSRKLRNSTMELAAPAVWELLKDVASDKKQLLYFAEAWACLVQDYLYTYDKSLNYALHQTFAEVYAAHAPADHHAVKLIIEILRQTWSHGTELPHTFHHPLLEAKMPNILIHE